MLARIKVVIQFNPALKDLEAHLWVISSFLGPPRNMTLSEACSIGSTKLLDWIWVSSCTSVVDRMPHWTLCNFFRSDPHYYRFQFAKSLNITATEGNLMVVKWLLGHFSGCEVPSSVIDATAEKGHLQVLELLLTHFYGVGEEEVEKAKKQKITTGANQTQSVPGENVTSICQRAMLMAAKNGHASVVRWLCANTPHDKYDKRYEHVIKYALRCGDDDLVKFLLPRGRCALDYADECPRLEMIEWMLECGYLRRDVRLAGCAIRDLADSGRLDLMQQIAQQHSPHPKREYINLGNFGSITWSDNWCDALRKACKCGELPSVQWLMEHPIGTKVRELIEKKYYRENLVSMATREGHCEVAKYLCELKTRDDYDSALKNAISGNHLCCVKVMIEQYIRTGRRPELSVIDCAAAVGHLEIVQFLHNFTKEDAHRISLQGPLRDAWWSKARDSVCAVAARSGNLELVKWSYHTRLDEGGEGAMDRVAGAGHLEVLKWLHANTVYGCTQHAMHSAATSGHLAVVQWLHANRSEGCRENTMDWTAMNGHLDVVKWMHTTRLERCTIFSIKDVTINGPLRVAHWLREHFRELIPPNLTGVRSNSSLANMFEMLLFQHAHYPRLMNREFVQKACEVIVKYFPAGEGGHMLDWIAETFGVGAHYCDFRFL